MQVKTEIINGRRRLIITKGVSGVDKTKEAVLAVMGSEWEYEDDLEEEKVL
ncbi:hypothetical protein U732_1090 [Clostridium argentinense CDC 2741]|uniref:Uncharacterized protein n=1 Tax=Clostridium argentinense CDC 2741 TaxID=1418104 RepID=A0A0C1R164_9CLOT|nr:hypothetical protein [Clostridium argentinense]KIE47127.1 hypothetical protein U732_1090 [Clostridium argentinense CDC 2741]